MTNDFKRAQTFSFDQMKSTLKMNEFKLRLKLEGIVAPGKTIDESPNQAENSNVFIDGNDWQVIVWGWKCNTVKIGTAISEIYDYIQEKNPKQASKMNTDDSEFDSKAATQTKLQLLLNAFELENLKLLKLNEIEQKQMMK